METKYEKQTPSTTTMVNFLIALIEKKNKEMISRLIEQHPEIIKIQDSNGNLPFYYAIVQNDSQLAKILYFEGAENIPNNSGTTPAVFLQKKMKEAKNIPARAQQYNSYQEIEHFILKKENSSLSNNQNISAQNSNAEPLPTSSSSPITLKRTIEKENKLFLPVLEDVLQNILKIKKLLELANQLPSLDTHDKKKNLILIFSLLSSMSYKYCLENLQKSTRSEEWKESAYIRKMGFSNLVKMLEQGKNLSDLLNDEEIKSLEKDLPLIFENFMKFYLQEIFIKENDLPERISNFLYEELTALEKKVKSIKALSFSEEEKKEIITTIKILGQKKSLLKQQIDWLIQNEPEQFILDFSKKPLEDQETEIKELTDKINTSSKSDRKEREKLDQLKVKFSKLNNAYQRNIFLQKENINLNDTESIALIHEEKQNELKKINSELEEKQNEQSISIAEQKNSKELQSELAQKIAELEMFTKSFNESLKATSQLEEELEALKDKFSVNFSHPKGKSLQETLDDYKNFGNMKSKLSRKGKKTEQEKQKLKDLETEHQDIVKILTEFFNYKGVQEAKDKISQKKIENETLKTTTEALKKSIELLKKSLKTALKNEEDLEKLESLEIDFKAKKAFFIKYSSEKTDTNTIKLSSLTTFQEKYEKQTIEEKLKILKRRMEVASINISIISVIAEFTGWQKECSSLALKEKVLKIIPKDYFIILGAFRNNSMHALDDKETITQVMSKESTKNIHKAKELSLKLINHLLLQQNLEYLQGKTDGGFVSFSENPQDTKIADEINKNYVQILKNNPCAGIPHYEQLLIFKGSVFNAKEIIKKLNEQIKADEQLGWDINKILSIMEKPDEELNDAALKIKLKYDALMQAFGQSLGNLRDLDQYNALTDFSEFNANRNAFPILEKIVHIAKDYRNSRTHNGFYNHGQFASLLTSISQNNTQILLELDKIYKIGMNQFRICKSIEQDILKKHEIDNEGPTCTFQ